MVLHPSSCFYKPVPGVLTLGDKVGGSGAQGQLWLPSESEATLDYKIPSLKNNENNSGPC